MMNYIQQATLFHMKLIPSVSTIYGTQMGVLYFQMGELFEVCTTHVDYQYHVALGGL